MEKVLFTIAIIFSICAPLLFFAIGKTPLWLCLVLILGLLALGPAWVAKRKAMTKFSNALESEWESNRKGGRLTIIIIFVLGLLLWAAFMFLTPAANNINQETNMLTASTTSGPAPLGVTFSGKVALDPHTTYVLDYGEPQFNYCFVGLTGMKDNNMQTINPDYHSYKSPGTYIAKLRKGVNCSGPAVCCTPTDVISTITITVK